jgi:hypothetical protein
LSLGKKNKTEQNKASKLSLIQDIDNIILDEVKVSELYNKLIDKAGLLYGPNANIVKTLNKIKADEMRHHNLMVHLRNLTA